MQCGGVSRVYTCERGGDEIVYFAVHQVANRVWSGLYPRQSHRRGTVIVS